MAFIIYGASGYTGQLITQKAHQLGLNPVLAGRSVDKIKPLAEQFGFAYKIFNLDDEPTLDGVLKDFQVVLHCAGPFKFTAKPMMQACLRTGTHYLDITGEIDIFEYGSYLGPKAANAGIMLMSGVGFDVVPTDCLGLYLKKQLPDATDLSLGFAGLGPAGWSAGTASTAVVNLGKGSAHRKGGKIEVVSVGHKTRWINYKEKSYFLYPYHGGTFPLPFILPEFQTLSLIPG